MSALMLGWLADTADDDWGIQCRLFVVWIGGLHASLGSDVANDLWHDKNNGFDDQQHHSSTVDNVLSGVVSGPAVQAGVLHGGVHFHTADPVISVDRPIPRQLPSAEERFLGRVIEQDSLDAWLAEQGQQRVLIAVGGAGGVGKTALVTKWLRQHVTRFSDGQLYADLGAGVGEQPVSASEVLGRFLRALGVTSQQVPLELAERTTLFRSLTADLSLALLLDNAVSAAQVRPLLPTSARSVVVVTSRVRLPGLALDGARFLDLGPLRSDDAVELLSIALGRSRVSDDAGNARTLVGLCSGFPLALGVVSARMVAHPRWSLAQVVGQLEDERRRLSMLSLNGDVSVQAVFDASYQDLSPDAQWLYRGLAVCPGDDFPDELVEAVAQPVVTDAGAAISELVEANLLDEADNGRCRYHDLLRVHARQLSNQEDETAVQEDVRRRAVEWYVDRAVEADATINRHRWRLGPRYTAASPDRFPSAAEALEWFEAERPNLLQVLREAHARGWDDLVWQWCEAMWSFFLNRKHYPDWLSSHQLGIESAARCEHRLAECRVRCQLGFAHLDLEHFDTATEVCIPALALAEAEGHHESISTTLSQLAKAARGRGELDEALGYLRRSLTLVEHTGNRHGVALRLRRIGTVLADQGNFDEALDHMQRSVALLDEVADVRGRARALTILGRTYMHAARPREAHAPLHEALAVLEQVAGPPTYQADILDDLATLAEGEHDVTRALDLLQRAEALYRESGHPKWEQVRTRIDRLRNHP